MGGEIGCQLRSAGEDGVYGLRDGRAGGFVGAGLGVVDTSCIADFDM